METITSIKQAKKITEDLRLKGKSISFVPTMGYLHQGHLSLMKKAGKQSDILFISIFVNPLQFGPSEDFKKYPRDLNRDSELAQGAGVDYLFNPRGRDMYGPGFKTMVSVKDLDQAMCGKYRPGHFNGVCTVVLKLFNIIKPHRAYFGQKDYQQLIIIKRMVSDLNLDIEIIAGKTEREEDGLAISSRNVYLDRQQRSNAPLLYKSLREAKKIVKQNRDLEAARERAIQMLRDNESVEKIDYFDLRDSETLEPALDTGTKNDILIAAAIWMGKTRLIDNIIVKGKN
ncbi:MAG: pantoate--beta-alanine ligase [Actinomycetia bacterium]|nr:pantoate--beta-alanine ligase [Actinomycetes bacterium]